MIDTSTSPNKTLARLADPLVREALCDAVIEYGSVARACRELGLHKRAVWCHRRDDAAFAAQLRESRGIAWDDRLDTANDLLDSATMENWQLIKFKLDSQLRIAGKLLPKDYGDQPGTQVNVGVQVGLVCDAATQQRIIAMREELNGAEAKHIEVQ